MSASEQHNPTDNVENSFSQPEHPTQVQQNGDVDSSSQADPATVDLAERPSKRPRLSDPITPQQRPSPRAISPPWRKFSADGPTSFLDPNGKRRSGRTNALPLDLQPVSAKRRTRASAQQTKSTIKSKYSSVTAQAKRQREAAQQSQSASKYTQTNGKTLQNSASVNSSRRSSLPSSRNSLPTTPVRPTSRRKLVTDRISSPVQSPGSSRYRRRPSSRAAELDSLSTRRRYSRGQPLELDQETEEESSQDMSSSSNEDSEVDDLPTDPNARTPRLKFKVTKPTLGTPSYGNTAQFAKDTRLQWTKRHFSSMEEWIAWAVEHGHQIFPGYDVYEGDDEYLKEVVDDYDERRHNKELSRRSRAPVVSLTNTQARQEAKLRHEVEEALQPGGRLHPDTSTQLAPEKFDLGRRTYAHWDHVVGHALNFRRLLFKEQKSHRDTARRLAYAAQEKWRAIQPKSQADMEREKEEAQTAIFSATMRQCMRDLTAKWDLIRSELDKLRLARWQDEQDALGKKALNKVMEQSALLLDARRNHDNSDIDSDSEEDPDRDTDDDDDDDISRSESSVLHTEESEEEQAENMSSGESDTEESVVNDNTVDEDLTIEELRKKYAQAEVENLDRPPDRLEIEGDMGKEEEPSLELENFESHAENSPPLNDTIGDAEDLEAPDLDENAKKLYDEMSEDSDESVDMSEEESSESGEEEDSEEDDDEELGLAAMLGPPEKVEVFGGQLDKVIKSEDGSPDFELHANNNHLDDDDEELEEVSLIPDAAQVQTPAASNDEGGPDPFRQDQPKERRSNLSVMTNSSTKPATPEPDAMDQDNNVVSDEAGAGVDELEETEEKKAFDRQAKEESLPVTPVSSNAIKTPVPSLLRATLREYQHYGLDWLAGLYAKDTNGILADEMGLGKTIQTISLLAHVAEVHGVWGPHLIVVPTSVMLNWEIEFKKFLPGFKVLVYYGTPEERKSKRKGWLDDDKWNVVITSYQLVLQDQASFKRRGWHYMVLDEAHNIKNWKSARWQTLLGFRTSHRLLLTGTPLQNNLTELWSLMFFLMPYAEDEGGRPQFTGLEEFTAWFNKPVNQIMEQGRGELTDEARELVRRLHTILRPYILRRLKADVEKQMPAKYEHVVYCKLSKRQRHLYDGFMSRASTRETLASGNYLSIINCLMQLRKVCNHPDLFETRQIVTSYAMPKSAMATFEIKDLLMRRQLLAENDIEKVSLATLNLDMSGKSPISALDTIQSQRVGAQLRLANLVKKHLEYSESDADFNGESVKATLEYARSQAHGLAADGLDSKWRLMKLRSQERPLMNQNTVDFIRRKLNESKPVKNTLALPVPDGDLTVIHHSERRRALPLPPRPSSVTEYSDWLDHCTPNLQELTPSLRSRAESMQPFVQRFGCITPAVVAQGVDALACGRAGVRLVQELRSTSQENAIAKIEPFHEAQTRLSIAFPDKRLLQYDCGKLQRLDALLRTLQAGGHRALIFTQMTKVLDILEQFLNIHGHRYLRLDGSTKIEQRQILTDRFNNDTRILAFILSSRSGGLGINLAGADTVIFYDLDWNPAMDKQCQDRCHRIGQTRDVHIYRFVSEYTIEANILRKANQKRLLDDVIIQDGDFTTEHFKNVNSVDIDEDEAMHEVDAEASAAMDRVLGGGTNNDQISAKLLAHAEDKEDIAAAAVAEKEGHTDDADFNEKPSGTTTRADTPKAPGANPVVGANEQGTEGGGDDSAEFFSGAVPPRTEAGTQIFAEKAGIGVDRHMLEHLEWELRDVPIAPPEEKVKKKRGRKPEQYAAKRRR